MIPETSKEKSQLIITIDTEGDNAWARKGHGNSTKNAKFLPRFQELCNKYKFKPTYLTTYEMGKDEFFIEFASDALKRNTCEIGLHPHPWNQPPNYNLTDDDMRHLPYMIEYPEAIIREKVGILTELLEDTFQVKMRSHRAGRWLFNATYARVLCNLGYKVDCSVTPLVNTERPVGPGSSAAAVEFPDYSGFPSKPYFLSSEDIKNAGDLPILELPMTIIPRYSKNLLLIYESLPKKCHRIMRGVFGQPASWFRPNRRNATDMIRVAQHCLTNNFNYIMFMLHSSELMPGGSPTFRDELEVENLYENITRTFEYLCSKDVTGVTCFEYYNLFTGITFES